MKAAIFYSQPLADLILANPALSLLGVDTETVVLESHTMGKVVDLDLLANPDYQELFSHHPQLEQRISRYCRRVVALVDQIRDSRGLTLYQNFVIPQEEHDIVHFGNLFQGEKSRLKRALRVSTLQLLGEKPFDLLLLCAITNKKQAAANELICDGCLGIDVPWAREIVAVLGRNEQDLSAACANSILAIFRQNSVSV